MELTMNKLTKWLAMMLIIPGMSLMTSCDDDPDDDDDDPPLVEDGAYITGSASNFTDPSNSAKFYDGKNEVGQVARPELQEAYVALKASGGFNIVTVEGATRKTWGPSNMKTVAIDEDEADQPDVAFQRGELVETTDEFTVPADGLYHIAYDTELGIVVIVPVGSWGIIGGATPNGWGGSTELSGSGFNFTDMTWTGTQIAMTAGDFKFRYGNGWKVTLDADADVGGTDPGVKVNSNFGGSVADLIPGGDNISMATEGLTAGYYDITVSWNAKNGYSATMTRTGDLPGTDFSAIEMGLVGTGFNDDMGTQWDWNSSYGLHTPVSMSGSTFTYEFNNIELNSAGAFKIRNGNNWDGPHILGYSSITFSGPDAGDLTEAATDDNIQPGADANYDLVLSVDGNSLEWSCTVTKK